LTLRVVKDTIHKQASERFIYCYTQSKEFQVLSEQPTQQHVMVLQSTDEDGVELWQCPICGHKILMRWPPNYKKVVLETGDENAIHSGGKGGVSMQPFQIIQEQETDLDSSRLLPWMEWLDSIDFESRWK
jgi:hypothetical protein